MFQDGEAAQLQVMQILIKREGIVARKERNSKKTFHRDNKRTGEGIRT